MASIADGMRVAIQTIQATYGDALPELDVKMYENRSYTLAAASCYAAAYAAASCYRDNMALQFYRHALMISNALAPEYPREQDEHDNDIERPMEEQLALDSELQASQMSIASKYGLLTYLKRKDEEFVFINLYRDAHQACMAAHKEAKALRHSPIDVEFAEVVKMAVEAIGMYYNNELAIWTDVVKAKQAGTIPELNPDIYIAETLEQRQKHSANDVDAMLQAEQRAITKLRSTRDEHLLKLVDLHEAIAKQAEVAENADAAFDKVKIEMDARRKELEKATGDLSHLAKERSMLRITLAKLDGDCNRLSEQLQTLVNLRAASS